ncbi:MAG: BTAD domain-containing putative transcriptional regulator, partial [Gemmatimonadales bacterium]
ISRDKVLAYLWPARDDEHARHSLAQLVYSMRRTLNRPLIAGDAEFRLDHQSLTSDIDEFIGTTDPERISALYAGPFLDGFHLSDAPEFDHWVERERERTTGIACAALETIAKRSSAKDDHVAAIDAWRRRVAISPLDSRPAIGLMEALAASGDRTAAVRHARLYETLMRSEMEMDPDPQVSELAERLQRDTRPTPSASQKAVVVGSPAASPPLEREAAIGSIPPGSPVPHATTATEPATPRRRRIRAPFVVLGAIATALVVTAAINLWPRTNVPELLAVGDVHFLAADSIGNASTFTDMLATSLARLNGVQVLSNARVQEVLAAMKRADTTTATVGSAAAKAGAVEVLEATVRGNAGRLLLDLRRVNLKTGAIQRVYSVTGADVFELADAATAALAQDFRVAPPPTAIASVTTHSLPAYRLYEEGLRLYYDGDAAAAYRLFNAAVAEDSTFPMAAFYAWRTATLASLPQEPETYDRLRRIAKRGTERERLFIEGTLATALVDPAALAIAETLATRYPSEPDAQFLLGSVRSTVGDYAGAVESARLVGRMEMRAGVESPQCRVCDAFNLEVVGLISMDSLDAAERAAREWLQTHPRSLGAIGRLADVLERQGRFEEALKVVESSDSIAPRSRIGDPRPNIYGLRAGKFAEVDPRLRASLDATPDEAASARWLLLVSLRNQGRFADALALASQPTSIAVLPQQALGHALFEAGSAKRSAAYFDSLSKLGSNFRSGGMQARSKTWALAHFATALAALGDTARLVRVAVDLQQIGSRSLFGRDRQLHFYARGLLLRIRGDSAGAIEEFRKSISSLTEGFTRENYELAKLLMASGRSPEAVTVLTAALHGSIDASNYYITRTELHELLGQAYQRAGSPAKAAAEFKTVASAWARADAPYRLRAAEAARLAAVIDLPRKSSNPDGGATSR